MSVHTRRKLTDIRKAEILEEMSYKLSIRNRLLLWSGVKRRFLLYIFNKSFVKENISKRQGKCLQCGVCCKLAFTKCPYLKFGANGKSSCTKYNVYRMPNCEIFPIDGRDIKERDAISETPCGYSFKQ